jgi:hypothetical protein
VFALILIRDSFAELLVAHKELLRRVVALVGVKSLEKVVAAAEELAQSVQVVELEEVSTSPATVVLLGVDT